MLGCDKLKAISYLTKRTSPSKCPFVSIVTEEGKVITIIKSFQGFVRTAQVSDGFCVYETKETALNVFHTYELQRRSLNINSVQS